MRIQALLLLVAASAPLCAQSVQTGQNQATFVIPRVVVTSPGLMGVTRPTLMGGFGNAPGLGGGMAGAAGSGLAANPNVAAARALFAPVLSPATASIPSPASPAVPVPSAILSRPVPPPVDPSVVAARVLAFQRQQAREGSPSAQLALARRYASGDGVERDARLSRTWLEAAARNGSEEAVRELSAVRRGEDSGTCAVAAGP